MSGTSVRIETEIEAPVEKVWQQLLDFAAYEVWNPVLTSVTGDVRAGGKGHIYLKVLPGPAVKVPVSFLNVEENRHLRWKGGVDPVFTGEHYFELKPVGKNKTRFIHGEDFKGVIPKLTWPLLKNQLHRTYAGLNEALKRRVESH